MSRTVSWVSSKVSMDSRVRVSNRVNRVLVCSRVSGVSSKISKGSRVMVSRVSRRVRVSGASSKSTGLPERSTGLGLVVGLGVRVKG